MKIARESLKNDGIDQWQKSKPNVAMIEEQIKEGLGYVYEDKGDLAGYAYINDFDEPNYKVHDDKFLGSDFIIVHTFMVDTKGGYYKPGSKFMEEIIAWAKEAGRDSIRIDTHEDNFRMRGLLEKFGYREIGIIQVDEDGVDKDRIAYELRIK